MTSNWGKSRVQSILFSPLIGSSLVGNSANKSVAWMHCAAAEKNGKDMTMFRFKPNDAKYSSAEPTKLARFGEMINCGC